MALSSLQLRFFRNYRFLDLSLHNGITVITGKNGIGKTAILEAIAIIGSGRSFRFGKNPDFIHRENGDNPALVFGVVEDRGLRTEIELRIYPQGKKVFLDKKLAKSTKPLFDLLPTIVFSPSDHKIIEGDSGDRKQFLNRAIANVNWGYLEDLNRFNKALLQRNKILKDHQQRNLNLALMEDLLGPWDEQLIHIGSLVMEGRNAYINQLKPLAEAEYQKISLSGDVFSVEYQPFGEEDFNQENSDSNREFYSAMFAKKLKDSMRRDFISGSTQVGPHKDEILLTLNANKVKFYGSQGEKRTCALALRLGELALFRREAQKMPVLLFDDVSSELDSNRRRSLVELLRKENTQVLITATELPSSLMNEVGKNFEQLDLHTLGDKT